MVKIIFRNNFPGEDWMTSFKRRLHNRIRLRKPEVLKKAHVQNLNEETLNAFFSMYYNFLSEKGFNHDEDAPYRIFNADELGCSTDPNKWKLFFKKLSKNSYRLTPTCGKAMYRVLAFASLWVLV